MTYQRGTDLKHCPMYCRWNSGARCTADVFLSVTCPREQAEKQVDIESVRIIEALVATIDDMMKSTGVAIAVQDYARLNNSLVEGRAYVRRYGEERTND